MTRQLPQPVFLTTWETTQNQVNIQGKIKMQNSLPRQAGLIALKRLPRYSNTGKLLLLWHSYLQAKARPTILLRYAPFFSNREMGLYRAGRVKQQNLLKSPAPKSWQPQEPSPSDSKMYSPLHLVWTHLLLQQEPVLRSAAPCHGSITSARGGWSQAEEQGRQLGR